jgi:hypothetical protein
MTHSSHESADRRMEARRAEANARIDARYAGTNASDRRNVEARLNYLRNQSVITRLAKDGRNGR